MRERLKGAARSVLFLVVAVALLVGACAGAPSDTSDTQQDDTDQLTYGEVMGRDVDELFSELESS